MTPYQKHCADIAWKQTLTGLSTADPETYFRGMRAMARSIAPDHDGTRDDIHDDAFDAPRPHGTLTFKDPRTGRWSPRGFGA